jgi:diaminopropionate ammonia-lyase
LVIGVLVTDWLVPRRGGIGGSFFADDELRSVRQFYDEAPDAVPTPLRALPDLAAELGLGDLLIKDESSRFGLPAFKILGARYAVVQLVERGAAPGDFACATAGNHGLAVAHAARAHGRRAHVYVPAGTTAARLAALEVEDADVVITDTGYDETVRRMARDAESRGWTIVSDTSWEGYEEVPRWIMAGYTRMMDEAASQWRGAPPDIIVVQAGVGSLAGAVAGWIEPADLRPRPALVIAEPEGSACVLASLHAGRRVALESCEPTAMVGLRCAEVSPLAWRALDGRVDAAVAISESAVEDAMTQLANPAGSDAAILSGASGACGVGAVVRLMSDMSLAPVREALGVGPRTRVLAIVTEGQTGDARAVSTPV